MSRGGAVWSIFQSGPEMLTLAANHDDPEPHPHRLPQKQGLCQVVNGPDFEMLSDF
jgi:hypothetical protein